MSFINVIKKTMGVKDKWGVARKWVVYYDKEHNIKEIKSLFNPNEYNGKRPCYSDKQLINLLTKHS